MRRVDDAAADEPEVAPVEHTSAAWAFAAAAIGVSFGLAVVQIGNAEALEPMLRANSFPPSYRTLALEYVLGFAAVGLAVALWGMRVGRPRADRERARLRLVRAIRIASPLGVAFALPALFVRSLWHGAGIELLLYVAAVGIALERLLRICFGELDAASLNPLRQAAGRRALARWLPPVAVGVCVVAYFGVISHGALVSHWRIATSSSDLAEFDNLFWNALHGHPFRSPAIEGNLADWSALKVHAEFILYVLLPIYALAPGPEQLLRIQTAVIALTAVPLYLLAVRRVGRPAAAVVAIAFLMMPAVQQPNFYDYHFTPVGMFFVAWTLCWYDAYARAERDATRARLRTAAFICFGLALLSREDIAAGLTVAFFLLGVFGMQPRTSFSLAAIAMAYVGIMKFGIMPRFGEMWFDRIYGRLHADGQPGIASVLMTTITNPVFVVRTLMTPDRFLYVLHMTVPLLFLWNRRACLLLAAAPGLFFTLMVTDRSPMNQISFQYTYLWVPYVVAASVLGLEAIAVDDVQRWPRKAAAAVALACVAVACCWNFGALLGNDSIIGGFGEKRLVISSPERARLAQLETLIALIPRSATVAATEYEGPHVSSRLVMYSLKYTLGHDPDFILLGPVAFGGELGHLRQAIDSGRYVLVERAGDFSLLRRGPPSAEARNVLKQSLLYRIGRWHW